MRMIVTFQGRSLKAYADRLSKIGGLEGRSLMASFLNAAGEEIRSRTVVAETVQTGLPEETINRAQQTINASAESLSFTIKAKGGDVRLKYFGPAEVAGGVRASPWNSAHMYRGAFITSGRQGQRRPSSKLHGHVFKNIDGGKWGGRIRVARSGLYIPDEMVTGQTKSAFDGGVGKAASVVIRKIGALLP